MKTVESEMVVAPIEGEKLELRRDVTVWGSYMWGYADVGADIYAALGLVMAAAQGATNIAFAFAGLVYIMIGLAYTELAATYPVAGGGQYFTLRGLGDFWGFVAGSALLLDYTIDIALFAVASMGYLNALVGFTTGVDLTHVSVALGPVDIKAVWLAESLFLIGALIWLNIKGIRESSLFNEIIGAVDIVTESTIIVFGLLLAWKPELLIHQWTFEFPSLDRFMYGSSLAIISFVGLESISQAAQETRRPATIVPRTSVTLVFTVFIFALFFSTVSLGILPWNDFVGHEQDAIALLASRIPLLGIIAGPFAAMLGASILAISANSGVMSASRLTYSMSRYGLLSDWFDKVHSKYRTPVRTILIFSLIGAAQTILSFLTPSAMDTLGNMYAFGATLGYTLVFISLIKLRFSDPYSPRPFKMPFNVKWRHSDRVVDVPILGIIGMLGVSTILFEVVLTHPLGRIAGPAWVIACLIYFYWYRRSQKIRVTSTVKRDWESEQIEVLTGAEEWEMLEDYKEALAERDKKILSAGTGQRIGRS
ncbi:MAG: APC family permease [Chloroflexi bacterium]|nr:APC family permease [Chloroflexota bacterium]MDA8189497.1 APC family permease [Dehalococcoidales bacterium]